MTVHSRSEPAGRGEMERRMRRAAARHLPGRALGLAALLCLLIGIASAILGSVLAPRAMWGALLANFLFWTGLAQGGVVLAAAVILTESRWGRIIQRIAGGMGAFLPFSLPLYCLLWFGRDHLFRWLHEPDRSPWLDAGWLFLRDGLALAVMTALSLAFLYASIRPDLNAAREQGDGATGGHRRAQRGGPGDGGAPPRTSLASPEGRGTGGPGRRGEEERERSRRRLSPLAVAVVIGFFPGYALLAIDLAMTLELGFSSPMLPLIYLTGAFYAALAVTAVLGVAWRRSDGLREIITREHLLYLGNLVWSFAMFLAFLWWSHYLIIWMANLPREAAHVIRHWHTWPWSALAWASLTCAVGIPFLLLLSPGLKQHGPTLAWVGGTAALGVLLQRFLHVLPQIEPTGGIGAVAVYGGITLGFLGAAALPYLWLMSRVPIFPVEDPLFVEAVRVARSS